VDEELAVTEIEKLIVGEEYWLCAKNPAHPTHGGCDVIAEYKLDSPGRGHYFDYKGGLSLQTAQEHYIIDGPVDHPPMVC
jgi:hypothetical protein